MRCGRVPMTSSHVDRPEVRAGLTTVDDFSEQWRAYVHTDGYYGSRELLEDVIGCFVPLRDLAGTTVAEIGCGNGRFIPEFARHARRVIAVEPGDGFENARAYGAGSPNAEFVRADVYDLPSLPPLDYVFCIGVLHHLPDPGEALRRMRGLLRPGGRAVLWVYGKEGNRLYLAFVNPLRVVTSRLPHVALHGLSTVLAGCLRAYIAACRVLPLPMRTYMRNVLGKLTFEALRTVVYDQLNPKIACYWTREEVRRLMADAGFADVRLHHRHGYSWTVVGTRSADATSVG